MLQRTLSTFRWSCSCSVASSSFLCLGRVDPPEKRHVTGACGRRNPIFSYFSCRPKRLKNPWVHKTRDLYIDPLKVWSRCLRPGRCHGDHRPVCFFKFPKWVERTQNETLAFCFFLNPAFIQTWNTLLNPLWSILQDEPWQIYISIWHMQWQTLLHLHRIHRRGRWHCARCTVAAVLKKSVLHTPTGWDPETVRLGPVLEVYLYSLI